MDNRTITTKELTHTQLKLYNKWADNLQDNDNVISLEQENNNIYMMSIYTSLIIGKFKDVPGYKVRLYIMGDKAYYYKNLTHAIKYITQTLE